MILDTPSGVSADVSSDDSQFELVVIGACHQKDVKDGLGRQQGGLLVVGPRDGDIGVGFPDGGTDGAGWVDEALGQRRQGREGGEAREDGGRCLHVVQGKRCKRVGEKVRKQLGHWSRFYWRGTICALYDAFFGPGMPFKPDEGSVGERFGVVPGEQSSD